MGITQLGSVPVGGRGQRKAPTSPSKSNSPPFLSTSVSSSLFRAAVDDFPVCDASPSGISEGDEDRGSTQAEEACEPPSAPRTAQPPEWPVPTTHLSAPRPPQPGRVGERFLEPEPGRAGVGMSCRSPFSVCPPHPASVLTARAQHGEVTEGKAAGFIYFFPVRVIIFLTLGIKGYGCGCVCGAHVVGPLSSPRRYSPHSPTRAAPQRQGCSRFPGPIAQIRMRDRNHLFLIKTKQNRTKKPGPLKGRGFRK